MQPNLDFEGMDSLQDIQTSIAPYLRELFSGAEFSSLSTSESSTGPDALLSDRSASLWAQLVAPPPLQPPNWIRSRIRRLFLVSLGVPVDLDEILPASKQKKLVLPSIHLTTGSPRASTQLSRVKSQNASSTSISSPTSTSRPEDAGKKERKKAGAAERPGPPPPPVFDSNAAGLLCSTTETAMRNLTDEELDAHVKTLEELGRRANEVLEYWTKRKESAVGDKEAFEGVIENLVGFVKKAKQKR